MVHRKVAGLVDVAERVALGVQRSPVALGKNPGGQPLEEAPQTAFPVADETPRDVRRRARPHRRRQGNEDPARLEHHRRDRGLGDQATDHQGQDLGPQGGHVAAGHDHERLLDVLQAGEESDERAAVAFRVLDAAHGNRPARERAVAAPARAGAL